MTPRPIIGYSVYVYKKGMKRKYFLKEREDARELADALLLFSRNVYFKPVTCVQKKKR